MRDQMSTARMRLIGLAAVAWVATAASAHAEITAADCDRLKAENAALAAQGIPKLMEKGPEWAKANLDAAKLASIKRLIDVSEQIMFRCEQLRPINARVEQVEIEGAETDDTQPAAGAEPKTKAGAVPVAPVPKAGPKPKSAANARTGGEPPQPTAADQAPAEARKPAKPRANDAYAPPAGSGSTLDDQQKQ